MEHFLKKIFERKYDDDVHREFVRFGKGVFTHRYLLGGKRRQQGWLIKASAEFANFLVNNCLAQLSEDVRITGVIVATIDLRHALPFPCSGVKQFMGVKQFAIDTHVTPAKLLVLMDAYPKAFYALSFSTPTYELKIKAKVPKSAKPAAGGEKAPTAGFCSLKTSDRELVHMLFFDAPEFKEISVHHTIRVEEIVLPKDVSDPTQLREQAVRKGVITRVAIIDGKENRLEVPFEA